VPLLSLFGVWLRLGIQSFGGGGATLYLIRRTVVDERGWLSEDEFAREWSLCHVAPGINLLAMTTLIGRRVGGAAGIAVSLLGLLLPSVAATILLTAGYARVRDVEAVRAALRGLIPATAGLGAVAAWQLLRPLLQASRAEGRGSLGISLSILLASAGALALGLAPVWSLLLVGGALSACVPTWAPTNVGRER
jgi:chromate transporter